VPQRHKPSATLLTAVTLSADMFVMPVLQNNVAGMADNYGTNKVWKKEFKNTDIVLAQTLSAPAACPPPSAFRRSIRHMYGRVLQCNGCDSTDLTDPSAGQLASLQSCTTPPQIQLPCPGSWPHLLNLTEGGCFWQDGPRSELGFGFRVSTAQT
jgi:hypothetical protein